MLVATEGVLTPRLQSDPLLAGFRTIVLDEFHERSLHADLALAFARQAWRAREDLRRLVMSATLDAGPVRSFSGARARLDRLAPERLALPSGRTTALDYREDGSVFARAKLQELLGLSETPAVGPQRVPIVFELLAPNGRPVQTTRDLKSFWERTYPEVRKELRGRYPKHPWPEDPWSAEPTHRARRRRS